MNYSNNPHDVRVDIFNKDLTYYRTISITLRAHTADIKKLINNELADYMIATAINLTGTYAVCNEPWNIDNRPVMVEVK